MRNFFIFICIAALLASCVSQERYDSLLAEKNDLQTELQELKVGVPALLADGRRFFEAGEYDKSKPKLDELVKKYGDRPESAEARKMLRVIEEEQLWDNANRQVSIDLFESYVASFPSGKYLVEAKKRIQKLKIVQEESEYQQAIASNSSTRWKKLLEDYPGRNDMEDIKKRIIRSEVDEIMGDRETGQLPSFSQIGFSNSESSSVSIKNDTNCELTVRYSGSDALSIDIPAGATRKVYLPSGNYRIAASACGANYAGSEQLAGDYTSSYYIVTTRY